jgi:hypothetical protein
VKLTQARADLAATLVRELPPAVNVYDHLPDQLAVPAVLIGWGSPWFEVETVCGDLVVSAELVVVAGRIDQRAQLERLEEIAAAASIAFRTDPAWTIPTAPAAPYALDIAGVTYLAVTLSTSAEVEAG